MIISLLLLSQQKFYFYDILNKYLIKYLIILNYSRTLPRGAGHMTSSKGAEYPPAGEGSGAGLGGASLNSLSVT